MDEEPLRGNATGNSLLFAVTAKRDDRKKLRKISYPKFTYRGWRRWQDYNHGEKVFLLRFQSLNGCTDNGLATAASFGALIIKRHMYVHQYHFRNLQWPKTTRLEIPLLIVIIAETFGLLKVSQLGYLHSFYAFLQQKGFLIVRC